MKAANSGFTSAANEVANFEGQGIEIRPAATQAAQLVAPAPPERGS
jgi:hypothetical protein